MSGRRISTSMDIVRPELPCAESDDAAANPYATFQAAKEPEDAAAANPYAGFLSDSPTAHSDPPPLPQALRYACLSHRRLELQVSRVLTACPANRSTYSGTALCSMCGLAAPASGVRDPLTSWLTWHALQRLWRSPPLSPTPRSEGGSACGSSWWRSQKQKAREAEACADAELDLLMRDLSECAPTPSMLLCSRCHGCTCPTPRTPLQHQSMREFWHVVTQGCIVHF